MTNEYISVVFCVLDVHVSSIYMSALHTGVFCQYNKEAIIVEILFSSLPILQLMK
jgi:hypothetical protein